MAPPRRHPNVVNRDEVSPARGVNGERYAYARWQLGAAAGGKALGASYMELPAGKTAWPAHFHCANEEALFVLQGTGILRLGDEKVPIRAGDYVALPAGPMPHQLTNDSGAPLVYIAFSTMVPTDVTFYPDSDKVGLFGGSPPGGRKEDRFLDGFFRLQDGVDYWDGEPTEGSGSDEDEFF